MSVKSIEGDTLPEGYGVVIFSTTFAKNDLQELPLYFNLEGEEGGSKEIRIDPDEDNIHIFVVKSGFYFITRFIGENNSPAITRSSSTKEIKEIETERRFGFNVEEGKVNYVGNIYIRDFSEDPRKYNTKFSIKQEPNAMSADITIRKRPIDLSKIGETKLKNLNLPIVINLMYDVDPDKTVVSENIEKSKKKKTEEGYDKYKWGMSLEEIKNLLELEKKVVFVISKEEIVDNTNPEAPIKFLFRQDSFGVERLYKVEISLNKKENLEDKIFSKINEKYGQFAKKEDNNTIWYTPGSKIVVSVFDDKILVIYESIEKEKNKEEDFIK